MHATLKALLGRLPREYGLAPVPLDSRMPPPVANVSERSDASLQDRLLNDFAVHMQRNALTDARVLFVGFGSSTLRQLRPDVRAMGAQIAASTPAARKLHDVVGLRVRFDFLVINFDDFEDTETGVDSLLELRERRADMAILLVSGAVSGDDLGNERRAICDATLRAPVTRPRLKSGLLAAALNRLESLS